MRVEIRGIEIEVEFDEDGFPIIFIQTNGYTAEHNRPAVQVGLNGVMIHEMFDEDEDNRWRD